MRNCKRCRKPVENENLCQSCKNDLLSYFEHTSDWNLALEMESAQKSIYRYR